MKTDEQYLKEVYDKYSKVRRGSNMNNILKTCATFVGITVATVGVVYGTIAVKNYINNAKLTPGFSGTFGNVKENKVWVGTFQLAWNELMDKLGGNIEFENETSPLVQDLNRRSFNKNMLNSNSYYIGIGTISTNLREEIETNIKNKFNTQSKVLDRINWDTTDDEYLIYAMLNKKFTFETPFPKLKGNFGNEKEQIKCFGLRAYTLDETFKQVTPLFYNSKDDCAVKISTKEGEEVILYRTNTVTNFEATYNELLEKTSNYTGRKQMVREKDELTVPFIKVNSEINYDELCNKVIKGTDGAYLRQAVQMVDFELDNYGGNIVSEAYIDIYLCEGMEEPRYFNFDNQFVLYLKEKDKEKPYFALLVDNTDVLVSLEE